MSSSSAPSNFPSNSKTDKDAAPKSDKNDKKIKPVVTGPVKQRKKPLTQRLAETFTGDDAQSVGEYILFDVFVPAAKSMLADAASQGAERLLFGEVRRARPSSSPFRPGYTNYTRSSSPAPVDRRGFSDAASRSDRPDISRRSRANHDFREVILNTRIEAEEVIEAMTLTLEQYSVVTVSDFYDIIGITGNFTDEKYGWFDLRGAEVRQIREGYLVSLPKPVDIDA